MAASRIPERSRRKRRRRPSLALIAVGLSLVTGLAAAPRYQAMECRGGGAMSAEYHDRAGSTSPVLTIRFVRAAGSAAPSPGQCGLRRGMLRGSDPTVLVYRARGEQITRLRVAPSVEITGVVGPTLKRLIERIATGRPFTVWVSNSGRGWWEIRRVDP